MPEYRFCVFTGAELHGGTISSEDFGEAKILLTNRVGNDAAAWGWIENTADAEVTPLERHAIRCSVVCDKAAIPMARVFRCNQCCRQYWSASISERTLGRVPRCEPCWMSDDYRMQHVCTVPAPIEDEIQPWPSRRVQGVTGWYRVRSQREDGNWTIHHIYAIDRADAIAEGRLHRIFDEAMLIERANWYESIPEGPDDVVQADMRFFYLMAEQFQGRAAQDGDDATIVS
ncbi:MAG: hypothetical protein FJ077_06915 [Cyanobacteria bacterium K_DeepCast_35m_m2_023]|nr:hypothetical protein [Cyanobacteria bacterium K_DeepCast_35m_m2_023]